MPYRPFARSPLSAQILVFPVLMVFFSISACPVSLSGSVLPSHFFTHSFILSFDVFFISNSRNICLPFSFADDMPCCCLGDAIIKNCV